jgi:HEAT repeat protein
MNDQTATVRGIADTTEAAFTKALGVLPAYAEVVEKNEIVAPASKTLTLEAADENTAQTQAQSRAASEYGPDAIVEHLALATAGRKGFLGLGARPDQYEARIARRAVVEVVYRIVPPDVQALQAAGDVEGLLQALHYRADPKLRRAALAALSETGHGQEAVRALKQKKDETSVALLKQALKDPQGEVRASALQALASTQETSARKLLLKALEDADPGVRKTAIQYLARTPNARTITELVAALADPDAAVRKQAVHSLGRVGAPAVKSLIAALQAPEVDVRTHAVEALGQIGDARALKPLVAVLDEGEAEARQAVPMALGNIAATARLRGEADLTLQVANALIGTLERKDPAARLEAIVTLQLLSGEEYGDDVERWKQWRTKQIAKRVMAKVQGDQARPSGSPFRMQRR